jgi:ABC-2 type transport system permease protein
MTALLSAELLKLRTIRATWGYVIVVVALAALVNTGNLGATGEEERLEPGFQERIFLDAAFSAAVLALLLGILLFTNEFRHGTITRTLLVTPRRNTLVAVKVAAGAGVGIVFAAIVVVVTVVMAAIWLSALDISLDMGEQASGAWRTLVALAIAGAFGAAVGGALHSQVGALVGALVWMFVGEPLAWVVLGLLDVDGVGDYLPASSVIGMTDSSDEGLPFGAKVAVSLGWVAVATALAAVRTNRRDIS